MTADDVTFESYVEREMPRMYRLAISLTGNRIDADDLVQDALTSIFVKWSKVNASAAPGAYGRAVLVNAFLSNKRRRAAQEVVRDLSDGDRPGAASTPDPAVAYLERHELLGRVGRLPPRQRAVVVLRYLEDLPVAEVAAILRTRESAVRAACHRGLRSLRAAADQEVVGSARERPPGDVRASLAR